MSSTQEKIVDLLFKEYVICDVLVDTLLPKVPWTPEALEDMSPKDGYNIARDALKRNLKSYLGEK